MQVPQDILKSVAFIACKSAGGMKERGTVFFVSEDLAGTGENAGYAVTARHVIDGIRRDGVDGMAHLRMNTRQHGLQYIELPVSEWLSHPNRQVDVAIAPIDLDEQQFDHLTIPRQMFVTEEVISSAALGPGDDLFFPGLFKHHKGIRANIPVVRVGNLSRFSFQRSAVYSVRYTLVTHYPDRGESANGAPIASIGHVT